MQAPSFGVSCARPWASQLEQCEAQCRREVQAIVSAYRSSGGKFLDGDFPPTGKALYINGGRPSAASRMPLEVHWVRASDLGSSVGTVHSSAEKPAGLEVVEDSFLKPGVINDTAFLGAVALLRAAGRAPDELIVQHDFQVGVVGVRLFKDGEWVYEIIDDLLPCSGAGELACGATSARELWIALIQKANAKIHGSYEVVHRCTEQEALEDLSSGAVRRVDRKEIPCGSELLRQLEARQRAGCLHLALRRGARRGELQDGFLAGHGYPVLDLEGGYRCRLQNPWNQGGFEDSNEDGLEEMDLDPDDFLERFTDLLEVRLPPGQWPSYSVTLSTERPSYPLLSAQQVVQCVIVASQPDRRWGRQDSYLNGLGLRAYRCRVRPPDPEMQGAQQDLGANPFEPMELVRRRPLGKTHSASLELVLEPYTLYVLALDSQYRCPRCVVRLGCSAEIQLRELSASEAGHFLRAQATAQQVKNAVPRSLSEDTDDYYDTDSRESCGNRHLAKTCMCISSQPRESQAWWWRFGC